jgi:probable rRNA maturation factor
MKNRLRKSAFAVESSPDQMRSNPQPLDIIRCKTSLPIPVKKMRQTARLLYKNENIPLTQGISVVFCSDSAIRKLNARYRHLDRATDVLSFTMGDNDLLGEIYISLQRAAVQARRYCVTYQEEVVRLFIHGFYHLLGYDHKTFQSHQEMERKENTALILMN